MKIAVCLKQVPDTETKILLNPDKTGILQDGIKFVVNPYDEYAIEEALKTKEKFGGDTVAVTVGPKRAAEALRTAMAMGIDSSIHILCETPEKLDNFSTAFLLSKALKNEKADLIFCGKQAIDDGALQTSQMVAEMLILPQVTLVSKFELDPGLKQAKATRDIDSGAKEIWDVKLPVVIAVTKGINEPRYASLPGIMKAKKKTITELIPETLGFSDANIKVSSIAYSLPPQRTAGRKIEGEPPEVTDSLVKFLRNDAKVL